VITETGLLYGWGSGTGMENKINKIKLQGVMDITAGQSH